MQESNTSAQNKLGELFVEFGSKGLGGLLGGLNGIQAQFLLTKNAAEQAIKPIWGMSKKVGGSIVEFNKLNAVTGMSVTHLMNMKKWADLNSIDFNDYIGNLKSLQQAMANALINRDPQTLQGFAMLGISPDQLDFKNPEKMINLIAKRVKELDPVMRTVALSMVGLNEDMVYAMSKANKEIDKSLQLSKDQERNINEVNDATHELGVTWDTIGQKLIGGWEGLDGIIKGVNDNLVKFVQFLDANDEKKITIVAEFIAETKKNFQHFMKGIGTTAGKDALTGDNSNYKDYNFVGKLYNKITKADQMLGVALGQSSSLKESQDFYKAYYGSQFKPSNVENNTTPSSVKPNGNKAATTVQNYGNKQTTFNNQFGIQIYTNNTEDDPNRIGTVLSQRVINALADSNQAYETKYGSGD